MSQFGMMNSRTSLTLSRSSFFDHPGMSRSIQPTQAGYGMHEYFPLIPRSRHHAPNSRTKASGISRGSFFQSCLYRSGNTSAKCGMQKWARFTRHVESSMMKLTGTRPRGLRTVTPSACFGRSPLNCANAGTEPNAAPARPRAEVRRKSRREGERVRVICGRSVTHLFAYFGNRFRFKQSKQVREPLSRRARREVVIPWQDERVAGVIGAGIGHNDIAECPQVSDPTRRDSGSLGWISEALE